MVYQRIFWLDDSPNFFDRMEAVARQHSLPLDISALLRRATFAFDLEMAVEIVQREQFDLYILDADFPNRMPDERRSSLDAYLAKVRAGAVDHWKEYPNAGDHGGTGDKKIYKNVYSNGFIFYEQQRSRIPFEAKVLMHSMSLAAPVLAYIFDLPIYKKGEHAGNGERGIPDTIQRDFSSWQFDHVPGAWDRFVQKNGGNVQKMSLHPQADLTSYEHGGRKELIERYLL